jgi:protein-disulfide isomerase
VRHDYIIPGHTWSRNAAIRARWFDSKSPQLGEEYRDEVFANQSSIYNLAMLSQFTEKFAKDHGVAMPFSVDPQNQFENAVQADTDLGRKTGVGLTPTIFIVKSGGTGAPFIEVLDSDHDLYEDIDRALAETRGK